MKKLRTGRVRWIVLALVAGVAIGAVAMQPALGGGLFTKKKATKLFYKKGQSDSRYLPISGPTQLQISPDNWTPADTDSVNHFVSEAFLLGNGINQSFHLGLTIPSELQGRQVRINSFELCYRVQSNATLTGVYLTKLTATSANILPSASTPINDSAHRPAGEATCRTYAAGSPVPIGPQDLVQINVTADFSSPSSIQVTRSTVNLSD